MKKTLAIVLALMMLIPVIALGENIKGEIIIGVYEPASGASGPGGKQETLGIQYAHSLAPTVELSDGVYQIKLVEVDNGSDPAKAPTAAQNLVSAGASIVLGSYGSGVSMAAADIFNAAGLVAVAISATNPGVTAANPLYYRICYLDPFQGTVLANYAIDEYGAKKAYTLGELGNDYDNGLINYFSEAFVGAGGEVVSANFNKGEADFSSFLTSAVNSGADVIFAPCSDQYAAQVVAQAATAGIKLPIIAGDTWDISSVVKAAAGSTLDISISTFFDEGDTTGLAAEFVPGFKAWLNANPDKLTNNGGNDIIAAVSALGHDGYMLALEALKRADSADREDIADIMSEVTYTGVTGLIQFDEVGDAVRDQAFIKKVDPANGVWQFIKVQGISK